MDAEVLGLRTEIARLRAENDGLRLECSKLTARAALCDAALKALDHFTFANVPDRFQDDADSCTEAIIVDAHVQEARRVIEKAKLV